MAVAVALKAHKTDVRPLSALLSGAAPRSAPHLSSNDHRRRVDRGAGALQHLSASHRILQGIRRGADRTC